MALSDIKAFRTFQKQIENVVIVNDKPKDIANEIINLQNNKP